MKIYILSPFSLLRPSTNRIFDMRLADGLAGHGAEVVIYYPYVYMKDNISREDFSAFYGLKYNVETRMLFTPLGENSPSWFRLTMMMIAFGLVSLKIVAVSFFSKTAVLSRDAKLILPLLLFKKIFFLKRKPAVMFMAAEVKNTFVYRYALKNSNGIFAGVSATKEAIIRMTGVDDAKFLLSLAPVPVYTNEPTKEEARRLIGYHSANPLIVYTGKLGLDVSELRYILQAAKLLPAYTFLFTGGRASAVNEVQEYCRDEGIGNVTLTGFMNDSTAVRKYQLAADVLVSYYTAEDHMVEFNYPQKINEYLSTGNPVVTPDFPATRDVLNENNVIFAAPDSAEALAGAIRKAIEDPALSQRVASQAREDVIPLSFDKKTGELIHFLKSLV